MFRSIAIVMALCFTTVTAQAALLGRAALTPGGTDYQAYYDDILNVTWSLPTWDAQPDGLEWASNFSLGGMDDWSLASVEELRHMRNVNGIYSDQPNMFSGHPTCLGMAHLQNCLPHNGQFYTSDTIPLLDTYGMPINYPLRYSFQNDSSFYFGNGYAGWAIIDADPLAPVPTPPALWLFGSALGLMGVMRRRISR